MSLNDPLTLASGLVINNRLAKAAMSEMLGDADHAPTTALVTLTKRFGDGGIGLQITGNVMIDRAHLGEPGNVVAERKHLAAFKAWARATTTPTLVQLNHPGRQSPRVINKTPVSASAVRLNQAGAFATPRALTTEEVKGVVAQFAAAAVVVKDAGFAGIEVHGAHGYLVSQFLSPKTNQRSDEYGGNLANRARFLLEIVAAVRAACGASFTLAVKMNSADFQRGGFAEEDAVAVARLLDGKIDLLEISGGTYESAVMTGQTKRKASTQQREAYFLVYAEAIRKALTTTPLMLTGGFRTTAGMNEALATGAVDVVGLARPLAVEPDLPRRLLDGSATQALAPPKPLGVAMIDGLNAIAWYQEQMNLLAAGKEPNPQLSRLGSVLRKLLEMGLGHRAVSTSKAAA